MSKFIDHGERIIVIADEVCNITKNLPVGVYSVDTNCDGVLFLKKENKENILGKYFDDLYEPIHKYYNRLYKTFSKEKSVFGAICIGEKGTGKSLFCRYVCNQLLNKKFPVIIVNQKIDLFKLSDFITKMNNNAVFYFDEFEKIYERNENDNEDKQIGLLSLLSSTSLNKMLFLFAINDEYKLNDFMKDRPGRIYYRFEFNCVDNDTIIEYCKKHLKHEEYIENIIKISNNRFGLSFDNLKSIVNESNNFNENPEESVKYLNISLCNESFALYKFDVEISFKKFGVIAKTIDEFMISNLNDRSSVEYNIHSLNIYDILNHTKNTNKVKNFNKFVLDNEIDKVYFEYYPNFIINRGIDFIEFESSDRNFGDVTVKFTKRN